MKAGTTYVAPRRRNRTWMHALPAAMAGLIFFAHTVSVQGDFKVVKPGTSEPQPRTWTSSSGSTLEATFVRVEGDDVFLITEDGAEIEIHASKLSAADIDYVKAQVGLPASSEEVSDAPTKKKKKKGPALPAEPKPNQLPFFTSGEWKGAHAVYQHANFDAVMGLDGTIVIYPKDKGVRIARPLKMSTQLIAQKPRRRMNITQFKSPGDPVMQPKSITLQASTVDRKSSQGGQFEVTYTFEGNEITAWAHGSGDEGTTLKEKLELVVKAPKTHNIEPHVEQSERMKILDGLYLSLSGGEGGSREYNYYSMAKLGGTAKSAELIGPLWEPRKIKVSATSKNAPLRVYTYSKILWEGFSLFISRGDPDRKAPTEKITLTID